MHWKIFAQISLLLLAVSFSALSSAAITWIDVRSQAEHAIDSIEGDIRITHDNIVQGVHDMLLDKSTEIHLYCRSGRRAGKAMSALKEAGYTKVSNKGGIIDVRKERGLIE
ncbi:rhodanese-like domain-containing protein [Shewanella surugensis]|uniref:Rhodanese-like domain-containing protein n=1 Tax=Shewanella surugensis TaxID=212020 RepID=A0ABT0LI27_9GAMM|nr:rhodanese-like domain-containing protein [Shewanella surugensis]MCL1127349.1 rhodanese-like domain-containing protein [Shewanella surugensis]